LWETISELIESVLPDDGVAGALRVTALSLDVPVEVLLRRAPDEAGGVELLVDLPRWRWTTVFDERRGRLKLVCVESSEPAAFENLSGPQTGAD
jgi:hypothetical protein